MRVNRLTTASPQICTIGHATKVTCNHQTNNKPKKKRCYVQQKLSLRSWTKKRREHRRKQCRNTVGRAKVVDVSQLHSSGQLVGRVVLRVRLGVLVRGGVAVEHLRCPQLGVLVLAVQHGAQPFVPAVQPEQVSGRAHYCGSQQGRRQCAQERRAQAEVVEVKDAVD